MLLMLPVTLTLVLLLLLNADVFANVVACHIVVMTLLPLMAHAALKVTLVLKVKDVISFRAKGVKNANVMI